MGMIRHYNNQHNDRRGTDGSPLPTLTAFQQFNRCQEIIRTSLTPSISAKIIEIIVIGEEIGTGYTHWWNQKKNKSPDDKDCCASGETTAGGFSALRRWEAKLPHYELQSLRYTRRSIVAVLSIFRRIVADGGRILFPAHDTEMKRWRSGAPRSLVLCNHHPISNPLWLRLFKEYSSATLQDSRSKDGDQDAVQLKYLDEQVLSILLLFHQPVLLLLANLSESGQERQKKYGPLVRRMKNALADTKEMQSDCDDYPTVTCSSPIQETTSNETMDLKFQYHRKLQRGPAAFVARRWETRVDSIIRNFHEQTENDTDLAEHLPHLSDCRKSEFRSHFLFPRSQTSCSSVLRPLSRVWRPRREVHEENSTLAADATGPQRSRSSLSFVLRSLSTDKK